MIRAARIDELDAVTRLAAQLWPDSMPGLSDELRGLLSREDAVIALYFRDGTPVAFAQCQLRTDYVEGTDSSPVGYLEGIFVEPNSRGAGVARELLSFCEAWARCWGCMEFASDCELSNTDSYAFHMSNGFTEANRIICFRKDI